jgi:hypothetical protein
MSDLVTTRIFTDGEKGITAAKLNDIIAGASIQTDFVATKPVASTMDPADNLLVLKSSGQYAKAPFQTIVDSVNTQLPSNDAEIWSVRLRSFNAIGNPTFEIDQRNVGNTVSGLTTALICDRWGVSKSGTMVIASGRSSGAPGIVIPGTNFAITQNFLRVSLTTAQASLASTDNLTIYQFYEGPQFRELSNDVHSMSLLVRSSVANLKFSVCLRDQSTVTKTLVKLCTIPAANVWTLIQLPNLPIWPAGNFTSAPGATGLQLSINLACGANWIAPAADTWQSGNFQGAPGMSNFAGSTAGSTFDIAFVQHEPGAVCSTLMDKPFQQNYDEALRYYCKSYPYNQGIATVSTAGQIAVVTPVSQHPFNYVPFKKTMAKTPTITAYTVTTGASNSVNDSQAGTTKSIAAVSAPSDNAYSGFQLTAINANVTTYTWNYIADTGW